MSTLAEKRILVTRPRAQAANLCDKLFALGAVPILFPTIVIAPAEDLAAIDHAIASLEQYHWAIFTSVNGVSAFWQRLAIAKKDAHAFSNIKVAAIGPATASALQHHGVHPEFVPEEYVAERILDGIGDVQGQSILLPRADIARKALALELKRRGAHVNELAVYQTLPAAADTQALAQLRHGVDIVTFTSSSTARGFIKLLNGNVHDLLASSLVACIGPITAQTVRELGMNVDIEARDYTTAGLVQAMVDYFDDD